MSIVTAVRTSRDPSCVARPTTTGAPQLCGLGTDASTAAAKILADLKAVTLAEAQAVSSQVIGCCLWCVGLF